MINLCENFICVCDGIFCGEIQRVVTVIGSFWRSSVVVVHGQPLVEQTSVASSYCRDTHTLVYTMIKNHKEAKQCEVDHCCCCLQTSLDH